MPTVLRRRRQPATTSLSRFRDMKRRVEKLDAAEARLQLALSEIRLAREDIQEIMAELRRDEDYA